MRGTVPAVPAHIDKHDPGRTMKTKNLVAALIAAVALAGIGIGAGVTAGLANAKLDEGRYRAQLIGYGTEPSAIGNARIVGRTYHQDDILAGTPNRQQLKLTRTRHGAIASYTEDPVMHWYYRIELTKADYGYQGVVYKWGEPVGELILIKVADAG